MGSSCLIASGFSMRPEREARPSAKGWHMLLQVGRGKGYREVSILESGRHIYQGN